MLIHLENWSLTGQKNLSQFWDCGLELFSLTGKDHSIFIRRLKQSIWNIHDGRDEEVDGLMSCSSRRVDTLAKLPDYLSKNDFPMVGRRAQVYLIRYETQ